MQQTQSVASFNHVKPWILALLKTIIGSLVIALSAQISIPLPFTPIPLTCQTLAILFLAVTLGSKQAAACTIAYLLEITTGLPILACGKANPFFMGPTAGYLLAMPLLAYIAGQASPTKTLVYNLVLLTFASLTLLVMGTTVLANLMGWQQAFSMGFYPFLPGEALKILAVAFYLSGCKHFKRHV